MHAYLQRFFRVSLETRDAPANGWMLINGDACRAPADCAVAAAGDSLQLHRCSLP